MGLFTKGPEDKAKTGYPYNITSTADFLDTAFSCRKDGERADLAKLTLKVGEQLRCLGKGEGGWPKFQTEDGTIISTSYKAKGRPDSYGLKLAL